MLLQAPLQCIYSSFSVDDVTYLAWKLPEWKSKHGSLVSERRLKVEQVIVRSKLLGVKEIA